MVPVDVRTVPVLVILLSENDLELLDIPGMEDGKQMVVLAKYGFGGRNHNLAVTPKS